MAKAYNSLVHLGGHLLAGVDVETTGTRAGYHEIIQIGIQPLNSDLRPMDDVRPFYMNMAPKHPERAEREATVVHGLDLYELQDTALSAEKVADLLDEWWTGLDLPFRKTLSPLAHNWAFECGHLKAWLGEACAHQFFHSFARDSMLYAAALNDRAAFMGEKQPFNNLRLGSLCKKFGIVNENPHDALADARAEGELYRALLLFNI